VNHEFLHQQRESRNKKIASYFLFASIGIAIGGGVIAYPKVQEYFERVALDKQNEETMAKILTDNALEKTVKNIEDIASGNLIEEEMQEPEKPVPLLENAYLKVPFVCQAPLQTEANWKFHEESCEEAALLQVRYYLEGIAEPDKQKANEEILSMIEWEKTNFGSHKDLYANDMKNFIIGYYGYKDEEVEVIYDADIVTIKSAVSQGYPVIAPIMGDVLQNPYYPYPGYHMLAIIGYTPEKIITNDNGTRRGKDFSYSYDKFMKALNAAGGDIIIIKLLPKTEVQVSN
jgi:hypothetical protein